jgi:hypothetical protein
MKQWFSKKIMIAISLTSLVYFGGCINLSGSPQSQTTPADEKNKIYETNAFTISVPKEWEIIESKQFTAEVPPETVVVFRNNVKNETFTANVVIIKNTLLSAKTTLEYAKMVLNRQQSGLIDYKESKRDEVKVKIAGQDTNTLLAEFQAKKSASDQMVRYIQTYAVKENNAFIVTGAMSTKENDSIAKTIENMIKSFQLK